MTSGTALNCVGGVASPCGPAGRGQAGGGTSPRRGRLASAARLDLPSLRRRAWARRIREVGVLLSLTSVLAVTAFYAWRDVVRLGPQGLPSRSPSRPSTSVAHPPAPRPGLAPYLRLPFADAPGPILTPDLAATPPTEGAAGDRPGPVRAPGLQPVAEAPPLALRSAAIDGPAGSTEPDLPHLRAPNTVEVEPPPTGVIPRAVSAPAPAPVPGADDGPRLLVGDASGRVLVSRLYARTPRGPVVLLPDGSLGWPDAEVPTDRPFQPWSARRLSHALRAGEFRDFRAVERAPFLVLTQGSDAFAEAAAELLQRLYRDLVACLEDGEIPASEPEFPLVAVIFRDEEAFRSYRPVDPDVRAYYEISTNRIILYEESEQDRRAPELARLRRPQTIAHEGVHQILQNVGVQPRLSSWPAWLVEGLAEYFAPTVTARSADGWADYGRDNFGRVNPFHMATLADLRDPSARLSLLGGGPAGWDRAGPDGAWLPRLLLLSELAPADYALAWSLTHCLARTQPGPFRDYLRSLGGLSPMEPLAPQHHLKQFLSRFGDDAAALSRRVDAHLGSLRFERVPFYAVRFEQVMGPDLLRRCVLVTPSPTTIDRWLRAQALPGGGPVSWWATPYDSRNRARLACESWLVASGP